MELTYHQTNALMMRFPRFELSYETISHKKVSDSSYKLGMAIATGKKFFLWFTFYKSRDVCYLMEIGKDKRVSRIQLINMAVSPRLALGTVLYGTMYEQSDPAYRKWFLIEDLHMYRGISTRHMNFSERLAWIRDMFDDKALPNTSAFSFALPVMWIRNYEDRDDIIPDPVRKTIGYSIHHVQLRNSARISPYINVSTTTSQRTETIPVPVSPDLRDISQIPVQTDSTRPQFKLPTVFHVKPDRQFDIYHLYAYGQNNALVYCGVAGIPTYHISVMMNRVFRNIRENENLDFIEESDDETDFEDVNEDKYVALTKSANIECTFHGKTKKWVPARIVDDRAMVVHVNKLVCSNLPFPKKQRYV